MKPTLLFRTDLKISRSAWIAVLLLIFLSAGCNKNDINEESHIVPLNQVADQPAYVSLPLTGLLWQLTGFANVKHQTIKLAEPAGEETFLLAFEQNGLLSGSTSTNTAGGSYHFTDQENGLRVSAFSNITEVNELFDGMRYIETMSDVFSYHLSPKGLCLFYTKDDYLLFHPLVSADNENSFTVKVVSSAGDCGVPVFDFSERDKDRLFRITGIRSWLRLNAYLLPKEYHQAGMTLKVAVRKTTDSELTACKAFGPAYPSISIVSAEPASVVSAETGR